MNRVFCTIALTLGLAVLVGLQTANAQLSEKSSSDFDWKYEMIVAPYNEDFDDNSYDDFKGYNPLDREDGVLTIGDGASIRGQHADHVWGNTMTYAAGWTIEMKLRVNAATGPYGGFTIGTALPGSYYDFLNPNLSETSWSLGDDNIVLDSNSNSDNFHEFRLAQLPGKNSITVWRDRYLIASGLTANRTHDDQFWLEVGDVGAQWAGGDTEIDYLRFTSGAWAPIPIVMGDANDDTKVDELDAAILAENWLTMSGATREMGDFNGDYKVDDVDATILAANWHAGVTAAAVPEPSSMILLMGLAGLLGFVRRRAA